MTQQCVGAQHRARAEREPAQDVNRPVQRGGDARVADRDRAQGCQGRQTTIPREQKRNG